MLKTDWDMLRESEESYRNLISQVKGYAIFTTDPCGVITTWNEGCKNVLGYDRDEFIGQHIQMLFTPEAVASGDTDNELKTAAEQGSASDDRWMMRKGGERFWAAGITTGVLDEAGNLTGFTKVLRDLTEHKQAEERLRQSQTYLRLLTESLPQLVWTCRRDGECDYLSPQWVRYTGILESEQLGFRWLNQLHPDDREPVIAAWNRTVQEKGIFDIEFRLRGADGNFRWFKTRAVPLRDANGKIVKWFGTSTDIEDQKRVEALLRENEERLRAERDLSEKTVDSLPGTFYLFDQQSKLIRWNKNLERISGYSGAEIAQMKPLDFIAEDDREAVRRKIEEVYESGEAKVEARFLTKDGRGIPYFFTGMRIAIDGQPCLIGNGADITELKQAEESLRQSEERYRLLVENAVDYAIITTDLQGRVTGWNTGAECILGYTEAEMIGKPAHIIFVPEDVERGQPEREMRTAAPEGRSKSERWHVRKDGSHFYGSGLMMPLRDANGEMRGYVKIFRDLTDQKWAEEERERLHASERKARAEAEEANRLKDEFLATVSHELRSPLNAILGWARLLRDPRVREEQLTRALETIERNAHAQARLIDDLLDVSRIISGKLTIQMRPVALNRTVEGVVSDMRPAAEAKGIDLRLTESGGEISFVGDADRMQQVVWNLLSNAIKFTPDGGQVEVGLRRVGAHIELLVSDTGRGIGPEFLPHVFDRFRQANRTDAGARAGLGLGLAITRYIVETHGGSITAQSPGVGQGASFTVKLPMVAASPAGVPAVERRQFQLEASSLPSLSGVRVLVVDDDEDARDVLSAVLTRFGAEVTTATDAAQALNILAADGPDAPAPDVLVSDINMPGMTGYELIRRVRAMERERGGRIPAVALTAYARAEDRVQALQAGFQMHVPKPIEPAELEVVVATLAKSFNQSD
ncbi:MAG: PAS domain S-box protein [Blastocatellales bacterium]